MGVGGWGLDSNPGISDNLIVQRLDLCIGWQICTQVSHHWTTSVDCIIECSKISLLL